ncbi:MAG: XTP/dITP diphosphatase [Clostridia bacterium]|nr:XTP/dITP diphosphatase [Clostridia bacterium]
MKEIILASNNKGKLVELKEKLSRFGFYVVSQREAGIELEVEENGKTFSDNAKIKAEAIYNLTKKTVLADDSGLEVDFLNGQPGVYSHRFAGPNATDIDRYKKVLNLLKGVPDEKRTARFRCSICYIDKNGKDYIFDGVSEGKIGYEPKGENGFGYDPIFISENGKTFAELSQEEKSEISHRGRAVRKLIDFLENEL